MPAHKDKWKRWVFQEFYYHIKNIAIAGGFLSLFAQGAGSFALDNRANK